MTEEEERQRREYYHNHSCCPQCGSNETEQTCVGYWVGMIPGARDGNRARCSKCGWRGIVDNMVPPERALR